MSVLRHFLAAVLLATSVSAQRIDTLVVTAGTTAKAAAVWDFGFAAYPVTVLAPLGVVIKPNGPRIEVKLLGATLWFRPGHGTFADNGLMVPLQPIVYVRNGILHLPELFYAKWLPTRFARTLRYDAQTGTLKTWEEVVALPRPTVAPVAAVPKPSTPGAAKAQDSVRRTRDVEEAVSTTSASFADEEARLARAASPAGQRARGPSAEPEVHLRISGLYADNFFQAPQGATPTPLKATTAEARFVLRVPEPRVNVHTRVSRTFFDGFAPSMAAVGGFDFSGKIHSLEGTAGYQRRSPRLGAGDQAGFASSIYGTGAYGVKVPGQLQLSVLGHFYDIYLHALARDSRYYGAGGALRYRGFGYQFSPEIGATRSRWSSTIANENYWESSQWVAVRAVPTAAVWLYARYRRDLRDYSTTDIAASNWERADTRQQWTLAADIKLLRRLTWGVYYVTENAESTRDGRSFTTQLITSGLSYRLW